MSSTRNKVSDEQASINRGEQERASGGYTFNAFPPDDYEGPIMVAAAVRLGDHAHVEILNGYQRRARGAHLAQVSTSSAGKLCFAWAAWLYWRDQLDGIPTWRIAEVECPTPEQLDRYFAANVA